MSGPWWGRLLRAVPDDVGCDAVFDAIDRYVEAVLRGDALHTTYASLLVHLRNCIACREDADGLLMVLRNGAAPRGR